jgi:hypothetical protein
MPSSQFHHSSVRAIVKFKAGKELKDEVLKLTPKLDGLTE